MVAFMIPNPSVKRTPKSNAFASQIVRIAFGFPPLRSGAAYLQRQVSKMNWTPMFVSQVNSRRAEPPQEILPPCGN